MNNYDYDTEGLMGFGEDGMGCFVIMFSVMLVLGMVGLVVIK